MCLCLGNRQTGGQHFPSVLKGPPAGLRVLSHFCEPLACCFHNGAAFHSRLCSESLLLYFEESVLVEPSAQTLLFLGDFYYQFFGESSVSSWFHVFQWGIPSQIVFFTDFKSGQDTRVPPVQLDHRLWGGPGTGVWTAHLYSKASSSFRTITLSPQLIMNLYPLHCSWYHQDELGSHYFCICWFILKVSQVVLYGCFLCYLVHKPQWHYIVGGALS